MKESSSNNNEEKSDSFKTYGISEGTGSGGYWWIKRPLEHWEPGSISCPRCKADSSKLYLYQDANPDPRLHYHNNWIWCSICWYTIACYLVESVAALRYAQDD